MEKLVSQFTDYPNRDLLVKDLANKLAGDLRDVLAHQDRASLIVPGGSTPGAIFDVLCDANIDWASIDVMLSDERWVPETSERSNTKLLRKRLLVNRAAAARFTNKRLRNSLVLERSLVSGTQRSSLSITSTLAQSILASQRTSKIAPGVLPPGTMRLARF